MKLSANALKIIAIIAMTIDHIAFVFIPSDLPLYFVLRIVGRLCCPIMCFLLVEGFFHTRNKRKYVGRMAVFAVITQPFYALIIPGNLNILYTFLVALIMLTILDCNKFSRYIKFVLIATCFVFSMFGDWSYAVLIWCLIFRKFRGIFKKQAVVFAVCTAVITIVQTVIYGNLFFIQFGVLLALFPLSLYSGKRGKIGKNKAFCKWFFYGFYPVHFALLFIIKIIFWR